MLRAIISTLAGLASPIIGAIALFQATVGEYDQATFSVLLAILCAIWDMDETGEDQ